MIRRRLAAMALTAGLGLVSCGCLNLGGQTSSTGNGGLFGFLHRRNHETVDCCPLDCPTCGMDGYEGPILQPAPGPATVVPLQPGTTTIPSTAPGARLVPTPATSNSTQMPWSPH